MAEAVTNYYGKGIFTAKSAGSQPAGEIHPLTLKYLKEMGIPTDGLCSQSWDENEAWDPDIVITVCDSAAGESCPVWFGKSIKVHWGLADPSSIECSEEEIKQAFLNTINILKHHIEKLLAFGITKESGEKLSDIFNSIEKL